MPQGGAIGNPRDNPTRALVFAHMWVLAGLFHMTHGADLLAGPSQSLTLVAAIHFFLRPGWTAFAVYLAAHIGVYVIHAPNAGNHEFFAFVSEISMLVVIFTTRNRNDTNWFASLAPILRLLTLILYFFAVFQKLNTTYLAPESCGALMPWSCIGKFFAPFGDPNELFIPESAWPEWLRYAGIYASLAAEASIPILLAMRRTWVFGFGLGFALHFFLATCFFWHFTPLLWALYVLFAPPAVIDAIADAARRNLEKVRARFSRLGLPTTAQTLFPLFLGLLILLAFVTAESGTLSFELARYARGRGVWSFERGPIRTLVGWLPFILYSIALFWVAIPAGWRARDPESNDTLWRFPRPILAATIGALVVLNGFAPYLGIKSHQSFAMFAGLSTHGGVSNHIIMPLIEVVDHQHDIVYPLSDRVTVFGHELREGRHAQPMLYRALLAEVMTRQDRGERDITVAYERDGKIVRSEQFEKSATFLADEPSWLEWKFLPYKPLPAPGAPARCTY